jgi:hypothetical protein
MKWHEYRDYVEKVNDFYSTGLESLCSLDLEPYFSWSSCECCNSNLGGDRYDCQSFNRQTKNVYDFSVCLDCYYYAEYGQLDDTTMLEVEKGEKEFRKLQLNLGVPDALKNAPIEIQADYIQDNGHDPELLFVAYEEL